MKYTTLSNEALNVACSSVTNLLSSGFLRIYQGVAPINIQNIPPSSDILAEFIFSDPAFNTPINGVATARAIPNANVIKTGVASFAIAFKSDGITPIFLANVGLVDAAVLVSSVNFIQNNVAIVRNLMYNVNTTTQY